VQKLDDARSGVGKFIQVGKLTEEGESQADDN
jgi:hypothetical protein